LHIYLFWEVHFTAVIMPKNLGLVGTNFIDVIFLAKCLNFFPKIMSAGSSQCRVRHTTKEGIAASRARIANRPVIPERMLIGLMF